MTRGALAWAFGPTWDRDIFLVLCVVWVVFWYAIVAFAAFWMWWDMP